MRFRKFQMQFQGLDAAETLRGLLEDDLILGAGGDDRLNGNFGNDSLLGGAGNDTLLGMNGNDLLFGGAGHDSISGGADDDRLHGEEGDDSLAAGVGDDLAFGGVGNDTVDGGRNHDSIAGNDGHDSLRGASGDDAVWGGAGNDTVDGNDGEDFLAGGFGEDLLRGGMGNDLLLSRSDAGEPEIAQAPGEPRVTNDSFAADDTLTGGSGADLFRWELVLNAPEDVAEAYASTEGRIWWPGVTGENDGLHDHWLDGIGTDVITDFNWAAGDRIEIAGHTVKAQVIAGVDADGDGAADDTRIRLYSDQGANGGAHHMDELGAILVLNASLTAAQVMVHPHENYGAYDSLGEGPHRFEDAGRTEDDNRDWRFSHDLPGAFRQGGAGADSQLGTRDEDSLFGGGGGDTARGGEGDDILDGGEGADRLFGDNGDDLLLGGAANDSLDGGGDDDKLSGGAGNDELTGGVGDDQVFGGAGHDRVDGGRNDDSVAGNEGNDSVTGAGGDDVLWGGAGNDSVDGGDGDDLLAGGFGADRLDGGAGNDEIVSRSDAGEPVVAGSPSTPRTFDDNFAANDTLTGGLGADLFMFEVVVNAPYDIVEAHADWTGRIDWNGVTGENDGWHDHWVDGIGTDVITDFDWAAGDRIEIMGHTVRAQVIAGVDADGDGAADDTRIRLYSDQGRNGGAHHLDELGAVLVLNALLTQAQVEVHPHDTFGAYDRVGEGPHRFEDAGLLCCGDRDWGLIVPLS